MSKKSRRQNRRERTPKISQEPQQILRPKWIDRPWRLIVAVSVILTIIVSFLSLSPSIVVLPAQPLDIKDPMTTPFVVTNESLLPIHSVEILCGVNKVYSSKMTSGVESLSLGYAKPPISIILHKEQETFFIPPIFNFKAPIDTGDITVDISYRPDFLFWRKHHSIRFVTVKDSSGIVRWYPKPLSG